MHRVPPTPTAVLLVLDPLRMQTFVLRLVVVPLLALGAAQRDLFSPHYLLLPVGRWAPPALLLRAAALSGGSLLRYTVVRDAAEGVSTPRRCLGWSSRGPNHPALRIISLFQLVQLSSCYRPTDFVLLLLPATLPSCPRPARPVGVATESLAMCKDSAFLSPAASRSTV